MRHTVETLNAFGINSAHVTITLNGEPVDRVVTFDEEAGRIERYQKDHAGKVLVRDNEFVTEVLEGEVAAYLTRTKDNRWPHAVPEPRIDDLPRVRSVIPNDFGMQGRPMNVHEVRESPEAAAALIRMQHATISILSARVAELEGKPLPGIVAVPAAQVPADCPDLSIAATLIMSRAEAEDKYGPDPVGRTVSIELRTGGDDGRIHLFSGVPVEEEGEFIVVRALPQHYLSSRPTQPPERIYRFDPAAPGCGPD